MRAEDYLLDLVAIPSVSPMSNRPVIEYVLQRLDPQTWRFELQTWTDPAGVEKMNLIAFTRNTTGSHADLAFVCHTDTVPYAADWAEAVHPAIRDGRVYGRGSCDVKSYLACVLAALADVELPASLAIVLTADEEVGCIGAKRLAAEKAFTADRVLIGEPTDLRPMRAGKGYGLGMITVRGREAHSAFPGEGRSAIYDAARVLLAVEAVAEEIKPERNAMFDPPFTTINIGLIEGGTAKNIVAGECRLTVEWRPVPGVDANRAPDLIRRKLEALKLDGIDATFEVKRADPPFAPSSTQSLSDRIARITGNEPGTISFGSEAAHLRPLAEEIVVFGPGSMTVAHKSGEFVPIEELEACERTIRDLIAARGGRNTVARAFSLCKVDQSRTG